MKACVDSEQQAGCPRPAFLSVLVAARYESGTIAYTLLLARYANTICACFAGAAYSPALRHAMIKGGLLLEGTRTGLLCSVGKLLGPWSKLRGAQGNSTAA